MSSTSSNAIAREPLGGFRPDANSPLPLEMQQAVHLARVLGRRAAELQTPQERRQQAELDRLIHSPHDKATLTQLTDQAFRSRRPPRAADQLIHILDVQGVPRFFSPLDRTLLKGFQSFGAYLPGVAVPLVQEKMHHETANVILPAEEELLAEHLRARRDEGVRMNVNSPGRSAPGRAATPSAGCTATSPCCSSRKSKSSRSKSPPSIRKSRRSPVSTRSKSSATASSCCIAPPPKRASKRSDGTDRPQVRLSRHGGVPRQGSHCRSVHAHARPAGAR